MEFFRAVGGALGHAQFGYVVAAVALHLAGLVVTGQRWRVVVAAFGRRLTLIRSTAINLAGIFVRNATPTTGLGGDASRIALLCAEGLRLPEATATFLYVRTAELPAMAIIVGFAVPALALAAVGSGVRIAAASAAAGALAIGAWLARNRLRARLRTLRAELARLRIPATTFAAAVVYAAIAQAETLVRQIVVAAAFGLPLTLQQSATVTTLSIAGGLVPTVGSIGAIDAGIAAGLMMCGATADAAVAITLVERVISYGLSTALGAGALAALGGRAALRLASRRNGDAVTAG